jgi:hypothetical protein
MHIDLLIVFVILLLGLILCSFLGRNGYIEGLENSSSTPTSATLYGPNGSTVQLNTDANGNISIMLTNMDGSSNTFTKTNETTTTYYGSNGETAQMSTDSNGNKSVVVTNSDGTTTTYTMNKPETNVQSTSYDNYNHYNGTSYPTIFYGPNGGTARVIKTQNNNTIVVTNKNGTTEIYYIDNKSNANVSTYYGPNGGSAKIITDNSGKQVIEITTPNGSKIFYTGTNAYTYNNQDNTINQYSADTNTTGSDYNSAYTASTISGPYGGQVSTVSGPAGNTYSTYDSSAYYNSLPQGIPKSQIVPGDEDLYILKSEVVPPVCPKCPEPIVQSPDNNDTTKCPPCPPCARCPEPAFDCKKVPNYSAFNPDYMPVPVLNDFSSFGM